MTPDLAKQTLITLVSNSSFFRGVLFAREAWGRIGFPAKDEAEELKRLSALLRELADALEKEEPKE